MRFELAHGHKYLHDDQIIGIYAQLLSTVGHDEASFPVALDTARREAASG